MKRRDFVALGPAFGLAGFGASPAQAQSGDLPTDAVRTLPVALPVTLAPGRRVEVASFFWYECPHCYHFEPMLDAWARKLPADVQFRRVPVGFSRRHEATMLMYYALESLGRIDALHRVVFDAIHRDGNRLLTEPEQVAFVSAHGVDGAAYAAALQSRDVGLRAVAAKRLADGYRIDGVPTLGIHGRFVTAPQLAGSEARALALCDALIERVRGGG